MSLPHAPREASDDIVAAERGERASRSEATDAGLRVRREYAGPSRPLLAAIAVTLGGVALVPLILALDMADDAAGDSTGMVLSMVIGLALVVLLTGLPAAVFAVLLYRSGVRLRRAITYWSPLPSGVQQSRFRAGLVLRIAVAIVCGALATYMLVEAVTFNEREQSRYVLATLWWEALLFGAACVLQVRGAVRIWLDRRSRGVGSGEVAGRG